MTKLFLLKLELFRKKLGIYGLWNILSLIAVLLIIFFSLKILYKLKLSSPLKKSCFL